MLADDDFEYDNFYQMSPPDSPCLRPQDMPTVRELSPFSTNTSMTSVESTETESLGYYREEGGRMFSALPDVPIVLPVDHAEMRRVSEQHDLFRLIIGDNVTDEVKEVLARNPGPGQSIRVLDVISSSPWIDEMAECYPHVKFQGCNFVPTRHPHNDNVHFEVYNLNEGIRGKDASFDVIHARGAFKMTANYKTWLQEYKRLLKPGGLLVASDLEMAVWLRDGSEPRDEIPVICQYTNCVTQTLLNQGIPLHQMCLVGAWLREIGGFEDVHDTVTSIPVGDWDPDVLQQEIGSMARDNIYSALYSVHPLWRRRGKTAEEIEKMVEAARVELYERNAPIFERFFYVVARRAKD